MKTEVRKVEIEREVYIAEDGTVFEDEDECVDYEYEANEKSLNLYDPEYNKTDFENCHFVDLCTDEDVKKFESVCKVYGLSSRGADKPGLYMWNKCYGPDNKTWANLEEIVANLLKLRGDNNDQT